jgi:predicted Zn finger-like uncharacterized protein
MSESIVLSCPNCATRFSAPAAKFIPDGRQVRCSQCQHVWFHAAPTIAQTVDGASTAGAAIVSATGAASAAATVDAPERSAIRDELTERQRNRGGFLSWLLWGLALLLLAAILAYLLREPLGRAVPSLAPHLDRYTNGVDRAAQKVLGTETPDSPLKLQGIRYDLKTNAQDLRFMLVEADLANTGDEAREAPQLQIRIVDGSGEALFSTSVGPEDPTRTVIEPEAQLRYFVRIPEPPAEFDRVLVDVEE